METLHRGLSRRSVLVAPLGTAMLSINPTVALDNNLRRDACPIRAIAFDGFTIFDPRPVTTALVALVADKGIALASVWADKLFALSWLETSAGRYSGFAALAGAALAYSAKGLNIDLSPTLQAELVQVYRRLPAWPDAGPGLERLRSAGIRLVFLSNLSEGALIENMRESRLEGLLERPLSTDRVRAYKPSSQAYAMATEHFGLMQDAIGFAAFGGWDALGACWFGYQTAWVNRLDFPAEALEPAPHVAGGDFNAVLRLVGLL